MSDRPRAGRRPTLRRASVAALIIALLATAVATWVAAVVVRDQEQRLLEERTDELALVFTSAISAIPAALTAQGGILEATDGSSEAYERAAGRQAAAATASPVSYAWLRPTASGDGYVVLASAGDAFRTGQVISDSRTRTFDRAMDEKEMVATPVTGPQRLLGFALGPAAAPTGTVLYRESALGPLRAPQAAGTAPFSELDVALYGTPRLRDDQVLVSTTQDVPLTGRVNRAQLQAGASTWLLTVRADGPLVGNLAASAPRGILLAGLLGAALIVAVVESAARRRDAALALYASEHHVAETLQRSLLPQLPELAGLDLAARYLASGGGQMVGGDWFDVFPLPGGRVGLAVGDVIGHDLTAASAMAQIRAALRAYAVGGDDPAAVITRLDHLVDTFGLTQLVTVVYGVLDAPDERGDRRLRYTNAGHLPPLLRDPEGLVTALAGGSSVVIGAPIAPAHVQAEQVLPAGSTLVLFTDGLVEAPGRSLDDALDELLATVADDVHPDADTMCEQVLASTSASELRDDVALLVVRLAEPAELPVQRPADDRRQDLVDEL